MGRLIRANGAVRVLVPLERQFLIGILACVCAVDVPADSGGRTAPLPEEAVQNRQGLAHFKQGYLDLMPKGRKAEADKQLALAEASFKRAIEIDIDCIDAHRNLARLYFVQRKFSQAATEYAHVIRLAPKDIDIYVQMALAQVEMGNFDEAVRYLEKAKAQTDDGRVIQKLDSYIAKARQPE
ncbi:MAG: tetratricopeptide repeat protein [Verrucomicrobiae bacterium]|nr:tetratricopeptide repeat protein [Verrucomicrobiae bacterium]